MAKKRQRGNGAGTVYARKNKDGKIIGYRGSYFTPDGKRRYISGRTKTETERALRKATAERETVGWSLMQVPLRWVSILIVG